MIGSPSETTLAAREHLSLLWPAGLPEGGHVVVSSSNGQEGLSPRFFSDLDLAAAYAVKMAASSNTYIGMAAQPKLSKRRRGDAETALAIPGAWADLDVKRGAFKSKDDARRFVEDLPLPPSLIVDSGGGLQAVWLLREPCEIGDDREGVARILKGWEQFVQAKAMERHRAKLDSVGDLARVLRVAGTVNHKTDPPRPVRLLGSSERRYNLSDFEPFIPAELGVESRGDSSPVEVDMDADLPKERLGALLANDEQFAASWHGKRDESWSPSEYDMSVARIAAQAGWTDGEITALILARRSRAGEDPGKAQRPDYMRRTIAKAREGSGEGSDEEAGGLARLSDKLGFDVERIEDQAGDKVLFGHRHDGRVVVVTLPANHVLSPGWVATAVYTAADLALNLGKKNDWLKFAQIIADEAERVEVPTDEQQTLSWVRRTLVKPLVDYRSPDKLQRLAAIYAAEPDNSSSVYEHHPGSMCSWQEGDHCVVGLDRFAAYLTENLHMKLSHKEIGKRLRAAGFDKQRLSVVRPADKGRVEERVQKKLWVAPLARVLEDE